jgi:hypothetical protein
VATPAEDQQWLDLAPLARVECSSEDPAFPIETAFKTHAGSNGWQAMEPGAQAVRLLFHTPVQIRLIYLVFHEIEVARIQEFVLRWRSVADPEAREIVRQRFTFSPPGTAEEQALYTVELGGLTELELSIVPEISGGPARASLAQFRLA